MVMSLWPHFFWLTLYIRHIVTRCCYEQWRIQRAAEPPPRHGRPTPGRSTVKHALQNTQLLLLRVAFPQLSSAPNSFFWTTLCPGPCWRRLQRSPRPLSWFEGAPTFNVKGRWGEGGRGRPPPPMQIPGFAPDKDSHSAVIICISCRFTNREVKCAKNVFLAASTVDMNWQCTSQSPHTGEWLK